MSRAMRQRLTEHKEVMFPVTPMLDMAFQLLAFFVLTFQAPTGETRLDLYLPAAPAVLPSLPGGQARTTTARNDSDLENDLLLRVEADDLGDLKSIEAGRRARARHRRPGRPAGPIREIAGRTAAEGPHRRR